MSAQSADILAVFQGNYTVLQPITARGEIWLERNLEDAQRCGNAVPVDHRCLAPILEGLVRDGLRVA